MTLAAVEIAGYRSIRKIWLPLRRVSVLLGANGVGKTNLYRALELLQASAKGTLASEMAREGGLSSVIWAGGKNLSPDGSFDPMYRTDGPRKREAARLSLQADLDGLGVDASLALRYRIELGFPPPAVAAFPLEVQIKAESLALNSGKRRAMLLERKGAATFARDDSGKREVLDLLRTETALSHASGIPALEAVRSELANWRFYHSFRTDPDSPLRRPAPALTAPMLAADGDNLAAVFATLRYIREETHDLDEIVERAFPGARLHVPEPNDFATFAMVFPETPKRPFWAHELSDGTLQFLALAGALLAYRLPPFIALNEPETSLHPSLIPALGDLIARAAERTQVWVVTHSQELADAIGDRTGAEPLHVIRKEDTTWIDGLSQMGTMAGDNG